MQATILSEKITRVRSEILVLGYFQDVRPITGYAGEVDWFTNGTLSGLVLQNKINGVLGETTLLATSKVLTPKILLIGLGQKKDYNYKILQQLSSHIIEMLSRLKIHEFTAELWGQEECALDLIDSLDAFLQGCLSSFSLQFSNQIPMAFNLLTRQTQRVNEMTHRLRSYGQIKAVPSTHMDGLHIPSRGLGSLHTETRR